MIKRLIKEYREWGRVKTIRHIPDDPTKLGIYYACQYYWPKSARSDKFGYVHSVVGYYIKFLRKFI